MTARFTDHILEPGTHAALPDPAATPEGAVYPCTTHSLLYRNDGTAWTTWATLGDPGTATALADHLTDVADAHDASAISFAAAGGLAATDVQAALIELDTEKAGASHTHALDSLSDVDVSTVAPTIGQALVWDGAQWEPGTVAAGGATTLNGLSDVDTATVPPVTGQALVWDGAQWEPGTVATSTVTGTYRGDYTAGTEGVIYTYDFASGTIPAEFSKTGTPTVANYAAIGGGDIPAPQPAKMVVLAGAGSPAIATTPNAVGAVIGKTVTKFRAYIAASSEANADYMRMKVNGGDIGLRSGSSGSAAYWAQYTTATLAGTDSVSWVYTKDGSFNVGADTGYVAKIEVLGNTGTYYYANDVVSYRGGLWKCITPGTLSAPGVNGDWALIPLGVKPINAQVGTAYTLAATDIGKLVTLSNAGAITLTVPTDATVPMPVGASIDLAQIGAGQVTVAGAAGVTVNGSPGLKVAAQYGAATLTKLATNTWLLVGRLSA